MPRYVVIVENTKANFAAHSPDVPGCTAIGNTVQDAINKMTNALKKHLKGMEVLPEPKGLNFYMNDDSFKKGSTDYILQVEID
jgi:predicted RNase H-like HicB family nuclease